MIFCSYAFSYFTVKYFKIICILLFIKMQDLFKKAQDFIKSLPAQADAKDGLSIDNETKLKFYALFKQITVGPNNTKAPSRLKIVDRFKWDQWKKLGNMSKEQAMKTYIEELNKKAPGWDTKPKL